MKNKLVYFLASESNDFTPMPFPSATDKKLLGKVIAVAVAKVEGTLKKRNRVLIIDKIEKVEAIGIDSFVDAKRPFMPFSNSNEIGEFHPTLGVKDDPKKEGEDFFFKPGIFIRLTKGMIDCLEHVTSPTRELTIEYGREKR